MRSTAHKAIDAFLADRWTKPHAWATPYAVPFTGFACTTDVIDHAPSWTHRVLGVRLYVRYPKQRPRFVLYGMGSDGDDVAQLAVTDSWAELVTALWALAGEAAKDETAG